MRSAALVKLPDNYINVDVKLCWIQHQLESHNYFNTDKHVCLRWKLLLSRFETYVLIHYS